MLVTHEASETLTELKTDIYYIYIYIYVYIYMYIYIYQCMLIELVLKTGLFSWSAGVLHVFVLCAWDVY